MAAALLETKLFAPRPGRALVERRRLTDRVRRGAATRLTLVSAPAGFGKTTILAELAAGPERAGSVAWVSLDADDNAPGVFWSYVIAALERVAPGVGKDATAPVPSEGRDDVGLATLLNGLGAHAGDVVLVLDDFHEIHDAQVIDTVTYFVEHAPANVHVVIGTRADPPLPLARLRAAGELVEIRAADLRFSPAEAASYLNETVGLGLTDRDVTALEERTEGWVAALQLAALSMQGRENLPAFIAGFAGDDRYVVDYLVEEVLQRQPEMTRSFLLQTSVLTRLSGPLADALTGGATGSATLQTLERGNLFIVPLDDRREWYRYHHLFADMLRARLLSEQPEHFPTLHRRASDWHEAHGDRPEAIRHALAGRDFERAAGLIELAVPDMHRARQESTLRAWFEALPDDLVRTRPVLAVGYVGARMSTGDVDGVEPILDAAERALAASADAVVVDRDGLDRLPSAIARYRAARALAAGDLAGTVTHAEQAVERAVSDDHLGRGAGAALLGLAHLTQGELEAAHRSYTDGMASLERGGHIADIVSGATTTADIRIAQGRLDDALRTYEHGLAIATEGRTSILRGAADMHAGIAEVLYERNDLPGATQHLAAATALGEALAFPKYPWRSRVTAARVRMAERDLEGAQTLLDEAERRYVADFSPNVRPVAALRARMWIGAGRVAAAWDWARARGLAAANDLDYLHEYEHIVFARLLLAGRVERDDRDTIREAAGLADRLLTAAEAGGRVASMIDILGIQAMARHALGEDRGAVAALLRAVTLAEPEGYVRVLLDAGPPIVPLLRTVAREPRAPAYARHLLEAATAVPERPSTAQPLIEPLSARELDVLRLLQGELDGPEIAAELSVSLNTLRTHTKNIYTKLGVTSRRAAVRRAVQLGLLAAS